MTQMFFTVYISKKMYRIKQLKFTQQHLLFVTISFIVTVRQCGRPNFVGILCCDCKVVMT